MYDKFSLAKMIPMCRLKKKNLLDWCPIYISFLLRRNISCIIKIKHPFCLFDKIYLNSSEG